MSHTDILIIVIAVLLLICIIGIAAVWFGIGTMAKERPGWVCDLGINHYMDGCLAHKCTNRDGLILPNPKKETPHIVRVKEQDGKDKGPYKGKRRKGTILARIRGWIPFPIRLGIPGQHNCAAQSKAG